MRLKVVVLVLLLASPALPARRWATIARAGERNEVRLSGLPDSDDYRISDARIKDGRYLRAEKERVRKEHELVADAYGTGAFRRIRSEMRSEATAGKRGEGRGKESLRFPFRRFQR